MAFEHAADVWVYFIYLTILYERSCVLNRSRALTSRLITTPWEWTWSLVSSSRHCSHSYGFLCAHTHIKCIYVCVCVSWACCVYSLTVFECCIQTWIPLSLPCWVSSRASRASPCSSAPASPAKPLQAYRMNHTCAPDARQSKYCPGSWLQTLVFHYKRKHHIRYFVSEITWKCWSNHLTDGCYRKTYLDVRL